MDPFPAVYLQKFLVPRGDSRSETSFLLPTAQPGAVAPPCLASAPLRGFYPPQRPGLSHLHPSTCPDPLGSREPMGSGDAHGHALPWNSRRKSCQEGAAPPGTTLARLTGPTQTPTAHSGKDLTWPMSCPPNTCLGHWLCSRGSVVLQLPSLGLSAPPSHPLCHLLFCPDVPKPHQDQSCNGKGCRVQSCWDALSPYLHGAVMGFAGEVLVPTRFQGLEANGKKIQTPPKSAA